MRRQPNKILLALGGVLLIAAMGLFVRNSWEERVVSVETQGVKEVLDKAPALYNIEDLEMGLEAGLDAIPDYILDPGMEMPTIEVDGDDYIGTIIIPDCNIDLPVTATWSYPLLKKSPCLYRGSIYAKDAIIMAHNYKIHFRPLWNIEEGTEVFFVDADQNEFKYTVAWKEDIPTDNLDDLLNDDPDWDLTLFTCTYGGESRVVVRCLLVPDEE